MQSITLYMERPGKIIIPGRFVCKLPDKREFEKQINQYYSSSYIIWTLSKIPVFS